MIYKKFKTTKINIMSQLIKILPKMKSQLKKPIKGKTKRICTVLDINMSIVGKKKEERSNS